LNILQEKKKKEKKTFKNMFFVFNLLYLACEYNETTN